MATPNVSASGKDSDPAMRSTVEGTPYLSDTSQYALPNLGHTALETDANQASRMNTLAQSEDDLEPSTTDSRQSDSESGTAKQEAVISATSPIYGNSAASNESPVPDPRPWRTTFFRWAPLGGLCCMLIAMLSILVSLAILVGSRGSATADWTVEPSAYLAICTAIANQSLRFAAFQGVIIAWWFRASRGATLGQLHYDWRAGTTVLGAISTGRNMGLIGLACLFSTLVAVDGKLGTEYRLSVKITPSVYHRNNY